MGISWTEMFRRAYAVEVALISFLLLVFSSPAAAQSGDFVAFESGSVRPMALSPDGTRLVVCNTPDGQLEVFDHIEKLAGSVGVGIIMMSFFPCVHVHVAQE